MKRTENQLIPTLPDDIRLGRDQQIDGSPGNRFDTNVPEPCPAGACPPQIQSHGDARGILRHLKLAADLRPLRAVPFSRINAAVEILPVPGMELGTCRHAAFQILRTCL